MAVNETVSYVGRPRSSRILHAKVNGVLVSTEGEIVTITAKAIGPMATSRSLKW
jgi:hypothetical protein